MFASLIAALIIPLAGMSIAEAESADKIGRDIVKQSASFEKTSETDEERKLRILENYNPEKEAEIAIYQDILVKVLAENYQTLDNKAENYFAWSSIGFDYEDNALEVTIFPEEFNERNIEKYLKIIRSAVGEEIDVTISPFEQANPISCISRTNCDDMESGVEIGMGGKNFPCTLGFAATYGGDTGFITAGHCFASLSVGTDAEHPENGSHAGDLVEELYGPLTFVVCDCAFVESTAGYIPNGETYGMGDASSTGTSTVLKAVKSSTSQSGIETGNIDATYVHLSTGDGRTWIGLVRTDMPADDGDSGAGVFSDDGSELLGILAAATPSGSWSWYHSHERVTQEFSGLTWDFP